MARFKQVGLVTALACAMLAGALADPASAADSKQVAQNKRVVTAFYDAAINIFRLEKGKVVEHWDVIQDIPEKAVNTNGMF